MKRYDSKEACPKCGDLTRKAHWETLGGGKEAISVVCACGFQETRRPLDYKGETQEEPSKAKTNPAFQDYKIPPAEVTACPFCYADDIKHGPMLLLTGICPRCKRHYKDFERSAEIDLECKCPECESDDIRTDANGNSRCFGCGSPWPSINFHPRRA